MCMFQHYCRQEFWHPPLDSVGEAVDQRAYANDSCVALSESKIV